VFAVSGREEIFVASIIMLAAGDIRLQIMRSTK